MLKILEYVAGAVLVGCLMGAWGTWVQRNDEHITHIMECLHNHRAMSHEEAVLACEREIRD